MCADQGGGAHPQGEELDPAGVEFGEHGLGGDLLVHDQQVRVVAADWFPVVAESDDLAVLGGLGQVGVGVDQVVGAAVLGEEGQHGAGALRAGGHVVLLQRRVGAPVHDGVEVQVEDRLVGGGQPAGDHLGVQGGEEGALVVVAGAVGVVGERALLGQRGQPGQQRGGRVGQQQVIDVGDPPGAGEFQRQQGQQPAGGGHDPGAGVAGRVDQGGQVEGDQVGDQQQQPGLGRVHPRAARSRSSAQRSWAAGCRGRGWPLRWRPGRRGGAAAGRSLPRTGFPRRWCG